MIARRGFIAGLSGLLATPAIVRANALMPVKRVEWYGRSPALDAMWAQEELNRRLTREGWTAYTSWFRLDANTLCDDWRYVVRLANIDTVAALPS